MNQASLLPLASLAEDTLHEIEAVLPDGDAQSLILQRRGDAVRAWLNICPHAGRRLDFAPGKFLRSRDGLLVCAVHGASFALPDGLCVAGPCRGEHLRAVPVRVEDGQVVLASP